MGKSKTKAKKLKNKKQNESQLTVSIEPVVITDYFTSAKIIETTERNVAITNFLSKHKINSFDINFLEQLIILTNEYSQQFYSSLPHEETGIIQMLERLAILQASFYHLFPLCSSSTDNLKKVLIKNNIIALNCILVEMATVYGTEKLEGVQFFTSYKTIKEISGWNNSYLKTYLDMQVESLSKQGTVENALELSSLLKEYIPILLFFYQSHPSFLTEKEDLISIISKFSKDAGERLLGTVRMINRQQQKCTKNRQNTLHSKIESTKQTSEALSYIDSCLAFLRNMPPLSSTTLTWHSLLNKIHSVFESLTQSEQENKVSEPISSKLRQEHISCLEKISQNSNAENFDTNIKIINNILDVYITYSRISTNHLVSLHEKILYFIDKNAPRKTDDEDDKAYLMYYASRELFTKIKEGILSLKSKTDFEFESFFHAAETMSSKERAHNIQAFFEAFQGNVIDQATFELILDKIENRFYLGSENVLGMIHYDLKTVNIWHATLTKLWPIFKDKNPSLNKKILSPYFSAMLSVLGDMISHYFDNKELEAHDYTVFLKNIKEKAQWFINDAEKYQNMQLNLIKSSKTSFDELEDVSYELENICNFYLKMLKLTNIHPYFSDQRNIMVSMAENFLVHLTPYRNEAYDSRIIPSEALLNEIFDFIKQNQKSEEDRELIKDFIENAKDTHKTFLAKNNVSLNKLDRIIEKLSKYKGSDLNAAQSKAMLKDGSMALRTLQTYSKIPSSDNTKEIVSKYSALCKAILFLIKKHPNTFECSEIEFFIKKTYAHLLNETNLQNKNESAIQIESSQSSIALTDNTAASNDDIANSFSALNIDFDSNETIQLESEHKAKVKKSHQLAKKEINVLEKNHHLKITQVIESNASELKEIESQKLEKIALLKKAYKAEIEKLHNENKAQIDKANELHSQKLNTLKQSHATTKQSIIHKHKKSLNEHQKKLEARREQLSQDFANETDRLKARFNLEIQSFSSEINEIKKSNETALEMLSQKMDNNVQKALRRYNAEKRDLKIIHFNNVNDKLHYNKKRLEYINLTLNNKISYLKDYYNNELQKRIDVIQSQQQQNMDNAKDKYESLLADLKQKFNKNMVTFLEQSSHPFQSTLNEINMLLIKLDNFIKNYNFDVDHPTQPAQEAFIKEVAEPSVHQKVANQSDQAYPPIHRLEIAPEIKFILSALKKANIEFYIVGGWIREQLFGRNSDKSDLDIAVNARPEALLPLLGEDVFHCKQKSQLLKLGSLEFWCEPWGNDLIRALKQRDFTVNALICGFDGLVRDPLNVFETFNSPFLTMLGDDPFVRIEKDPSLILRSLRFASLLNKQINDNDWNAINTHHYLIAHLPAGIYLNNITKMFMSQNGVNCFDFICQGELLPLVFPFLNETDHLTQGFPIHHYIIDNIHKFSLMNKKEKDPFSFLALMMLIPLTQNEDLLTHLNIILEESDEYAEKHLFIIASRIIEDRLMNHNSLNTPSIINKFKSHCLSEQGCIKKYVDFYREHYMPQTTLPISVVDFEEQYLLLTPQYTASKRSSDMETSQKHAFFKNQMKN